MVVQWGGAVSYERGTPVQGAAAAAAWVMVADGGKVNPKPHTLNREL